MLFVKDGIIWIKAQYYHSQKKCDAMHEVKVAIANESVSASCVQRNLLMCGWESWNMQPCQLFGEANNSLCHDETRLLPVTYPVCKCNSHRIMLAHPY